MEEAMARVVTFDDVLRLAAQLTALEKLRLVGILAPQIERDLRSPKPTPRKSLRGLWKGVDITDEDIKEVRREMWANFPRDDF